MANILSQTRDIKHKKIVELLFLLISLKALKANNPANLQIIMIKFLNNMILISDYQTFKVSQLSTKKDKVYLGNYITWNSLISQSRAKQMYYQFIKKQLFNCYYLVIFLNYSIYFINRLNILKKLSDWYKEDRVSKAIMTQKEKMN